MSEFPPIEVVDGEPNGGQPVRTAVFVVLGVAVAAFLVLQQAAALHQAQQPAPPQPAEDRVVEAQLRFSDLIAAYYVFVRFIAEEAVPPQDRARFEAELARGFREQVVVAGDRPALLRRTGVIAMWLERSDANYRLLVEAARRAQQANPDLAAAERELWQAIYDDPAKLTEEQWEELEPALDRLDLGWSAWAVRARAYELLGRVQEERRATRALRAAATDRVLPVLVIGLSVLVLGVLGLIGLIVVVVLLATGAIRPRGVPRPVPARTLWETFILAVVLWIVLQLAIVASGWEPEGIEVLAVGAAGQLLMFAALLWLRVGDRPVGASEIGWKLRPLGDIFCGIAGYVTALPLIALAAILTLVLIDLTGIGPNPAGQPLEELIGRGEGTGSVVALFVLASVIAPIVEETVFRGVLQGAIRQRFGGFWAITGSALVFAAAHPYGPLFLLPLFTMGIVLASLYWLRGSLLPGMVAHAVHNTLVLTMLVLIFR